MCSSVAQIEKEIVEHLNTIDSARDIPDRFKKLGEEFGELGEALIRGHDKEALKEAADCVIVLIDLIALFGSDLEKEVISKLKELKERNEAETLH